MAYRNFLYLIFGILLPSLISGCGFHLRGAAELPPSISPMFIEGLGAHDPMMQALQQNFASADVKLTDKRAEARTILRLRSLDQDRRVLSVDGSGKVVEYELYQALEFDLISADGNILSQTQTIGSQRAYINTETEVLGKTEEEADVREDMRQELVSRIISRLQTQLRVTSN